MRDRRGLRGVPRHGVPGGAGPPRPGPRHPPSPLPPVEGGRHAAEVLLVQGGNSQDPAIPGLLRPHPPRRHSRGEICRDQIYLVT